MSIDSCDIFQIVGKFAILKNNIQLSYVSMKIRHQVNTRIRLFESAQYVWTFYNVCLLTIMFRRQKRAILLRNLLLSLLTTIEVNFFFLLLTTALLKEVFHGYIDIDLFSLRARSLNLYERTLNEPSVESFLLHLQQTIVSSK